MIFPKPDQFTDAQVEADPILRYFHFAHLPPALREISEPFCALAGAVVAMLPRNAERSVALRKLLEAKDAAVRANVPAAGGRKETFFDRLLAESKALEEKFEKLSGFMETFDFAALPQLEQDDLKAQYEVMGAYREILGRRIARLGTGTDRGPSTNTHIDAGDDAEVRITGGGSSEEPLPFSG